MPISYALATVINQNNTMCQAKQKGAQPLVNRNSQDLK